MLMRLNDLLLLWDYTYWANGRILSVAERLTPEQYIDEPPLGGSRSLRDTLVHALNAEQGWRQGMQGTPRAEVTGYTTEQLPDVATLRAAWAESEAAMRVWLDQLDDLALADEAIFGCPLWQIMAHVVNHDMQHRTEAAMLLTHCGHSPGDLDLLFYLEERAGQPTD
jgi:uncharacterized damage-inducible protein DinB